MYRDLQYGQVLYGRFNDYRKMWEDLNAIARKRGWPPWTIWVPTVGVVNEVIVEREFRDLASYAKAYDEFQSDAEVMKLYRAGGSVVVQGSGRNELWEEVTKPLA